MKILIVGSTSVVGLALRERLKAMGAVTMAGRSHADIHLDLANPQAVAEIEGRFDVVVHVAADFGGETDDDIVRAELVNAVGAIAVCRLAQQVQAKHVLLVSTISASYRPSDPYFGIYALSKRHGEEVARYFCARRGMPLTILRPTQIYDDAGACRRHQGFLYAMADQARAGNDIVIYGSNDARRNYIHIEDFAEICCRVIERRQVGTFVCAHRKSVRLSEIANAALMVANSPGKVKFLEEQPSLPDLPLIEDFELYDLLGYSPAVDIVEGMARVVRHQGEVH